MKWFLEALTKKYATFAGRARRSEYWYFVLFYVLAAVALSIIDVVVGGAKFRGDYQGGMPKLECPTCGRETMEYVDQEA